MLGRATSSAELPAVATVHTGDEGCHGLISAPRLHLIVLRLPLPALATLELVGSCLHKVAHPGLQAGGAGQICAGVLLSKPSSVP